MAPDSGMVLGIGIMMVLMVAGAFLAFLLVARWIARAREWPRGRASAVAAIAGIIGVVVGLLWMNWTFYWSD